METLRQRKKQLAKAPKISTDNISNKIEVTLTSQSVFTA